MRQLTLFNNTKYDVLLNALQTLNLPVEEHRRVVNIANDRSQSLLTFDAHVIKVEDRGSGIDGDYIEFYFDAEDGSFVDYAILQAPCAIIGPENGT